jgi:hypothetical protein
VQCAFLNKYPLVAASPHAFSTTKIDWNTSLNEPIASNSAQQPEQTPPSCHSLPGTPCKTLLAIVACSHVLTPPRSDIIKIIFAIILPPLGVFLERGCNADL